MATALANTQQASERIITSLDKGLRILSSLADEPEPVGLADLSRRFPWDKSTVYRVLETLQARGFVEQGARGYVLGPGARRLASRPAGDLLDAARSAMRRLADQTGENAHVAAHANGEMVFVDQASGGRFTLHTEIGGREPLYCTAIGKAYLMTLADTEFNAALRAIRYVQFTGHTLSKAAALRKDIEHARKAGFAVDEREYSEDVRCAAAPVVDAANRFAFALGVSAPASRVSAANLREWGRLCAELARTLEK